MTGANALPWLLVIPTIAFAVLIRASHHWVRLVLACALLVALGYAVQPMVGSLVDPTFPADIAGIGLFGRRALLALWWLLVARTAILAGQLALGLDRQHRPTRLASDLVAGIIYLAAAIAVLDLAFGVSVTGLVATSGIIAIVLGLALQSTLGDLFSGLAIGIDRPFKVGDVIWIEGAVEGRVVEVNWRSTRLATASADVATVPNSVIAKSRLLNRSSPSENHIESVRLVLDPDVLPPDAMEVLRAAVRNASLLSPEPEPSIGCVDLRGDGFTYEITFTAPLGKVGGARSDLLRQVARHLRHAGIALAPQNGVALQRRSIPTLLDNLKTNLLLGALSEEDLRELATGIRTVQGRPGDAIFEQGGHLASMFIIHQGAFEVVRGGVEGRSHRLGTIGPGDYFGELALLTGARNAATVRALSAYEAYEIPKSAIAPLLARDPKLMHDFEEGAARAQALLDRTISEETCATPTSHERLLDRIAAFFGTTKEGTSTNGSPSHG